MEKTQSRGVTGERIINLVKKYEKKESRVHLIYKKPRNK